MPARRAPSPSSSSTTSIYLRYLDQRAGRAASTSRSCPASCRCRTSSRRRASPARPAPRCRNGWPTASRGSTTIPRRAGCRRGGRGRAGARPRRPRRPRLPLLHDEQGRSRLRHLPSARACGPSWSRRRPRTARLDAPASQRDEATRPRIFRQRLTACPVHRSTPSQAAARERILVLDGAMGTMIQGPSSTEEHFRGERFAGLAARPARQQRPADPDPARRDRGHPPRLFPGRRRHRRDQHLLLAPPSPRPITAWRRWSTS